MEMKIPKEVGALVVIAIFLFLGWVVVDMLVLGNQEIKNPDIVFQQNLYTRLLFGGMFGVFVIYFTRRWWRGDNKYGDSFGFFNIGEKPSFSFFKRYSPLQLVLLSYIFFISIFFMVNLAKFGGFTSSQVLPQQFTPAESLAFSSLLIPFAEESMNIFVMSLLVLGLILLAIKYKMSYDNFKIYYFVAIPLIMGVVALIWHSSAYPGSDIAKSVVYLFWTLKAFLILATGFVFIGVAMHQPNNFFIDFSRLYSSDFVLSMTILALIGIVVAYIFLYRKNGAWYKGVNRAR